MRTIIFFWSYLRYNSLFSGADAGGIESKKIVAVVGGNGEKANLAPELNEFPFKMFASPETQIESGRTRQVEESEDDKSSPKKKLTLMLARPLKYFQMGKYMPHIDAGNPALVLPSKGGEGTFEALKVFPPYENQYNKDLIPIYNKNGKKIANVPYIEGLKDFKSDEHKREYIPTARSSVVDAETMGSLSAHLSFESFQGASVLDESDNKNNGSMWGAATTMQTNYSCGMACRLINGAVIFNGDQFKLKPSRAVTIAVWLKLNSTQGTHSIFTTDLMATAGHYDLEVQDGRMKWMYTNGEKKVFECWTQRAVVEAHRWIHVAAAYDSGESKWKSIVWTAYLFIVFFAHRIYISNAIYLLCINDFM